MGQDASEIRREIEETRARMSETVDAIGYKADVPARVRESVSERLETIKGTIGAAMENVRSTVANAADTVAGAASGATSVAGSAAKAGVQRGADLAGNAADAARETTSKASRNVSFATRNPLGLALGGLAIGLIAGMLLPRTDLENEQLGPVRDRLKDEITEKAQTALGDAVEAGKSALAGTLVSSVSGTTHGNSSSSAATSSSGTTTPTSI